MANEKIAAGVAKILAAAKSIRSRYAAKKLTSILTADRKAIEQGLLDIGDADVPVILTRINGVPVPTPNPPEPPAPSNFRNWPSMLVNWLQGNTTNGADTTAGREAIAKTDICVLQYKWASGRSQDLTNITAIKSIRSDVILGSYCEVRFWTSGAESNTDDYTRWVYDVVAAGPGGGTSGPWRLRNSSGGGLFHRFNPADMRATNMAVQLSGTNGSGQRMSQALAAKYYADLNDAAGDRRSIYRCIGFDDYNIIDDPKNSDSSSATADYEQNGVSDDVLDNTTSGGGYKFRTGMTQNLNDWRTQFPGWLIFANSDFGLPYVQSTTPIRPVTSNEMYRQADIWLIENPYLYRFRIGNGTTTYPIGAGITLNEGWVQLMLNQQFSKPDADSPLNKRCFSVYEQIPRSSSQSLSSTDIAFCRMVYAHTMSIEGGAIALTYSGADRPVWLDEMAIKFGNRISAGTMGTLNDSSAPVTITLRAADFTGGGGEKFYWTEFDNALVVFRYDFVSITPGSSNFGDGTAASCTLPSAGTGYRWDEFNASTYVHPDYSDLAMTGQDTSFNSGATNITSVSLKPLHAKFFRRVAV